MHETFSIFHLRVLVFLFFEKYMTSFPFLHLLTAKLRRSQISFVLDYHLHNLNKTHAFVSVNMHLIDFISGPK